MHNLIQALVDFHDKVRSENTVLVGSGMYGIPSLFIREALLEPFYTVIGELIGNSIATFHFNTGWL